jgi:hypothetical protein
MVSDKDKVPIYESRRLLLPIETALDAAIEFDRQQGGSLWQNDVTETRLVSGRDPMLVVTTQAPGQAPERRQFDLPTLAAAIIHYCVRARIPLPRQGRKSIEISQEGVTFSLDTTVKLDRRHPLNLRQRGGDLLIG